MQGPPTIVELLYSAICYRRFCYPDSNPTGSQPKSIPLQGSFHLGHICLHTAFIFQVTIMNSSPASTEEDICSTTTRKLQGFGHSVACRSFPKKLHRVGITWQAWNFLKPSYDQSTFSVLWNG